MTHLFTYGSLMCKDIMKMVSGQESLQKKARLDGFFRSQIVDETYPGIFPQTNRYVKGMIYFDLTQTALARLDAFEGEYYIRSQIHINCDEMGVIPAAAYIIKPSYQHLLTGKEWSFEDFLTSGKQEFLSKYVGFKKIE